MSARTTATVSIKAIEHNLQLLRQKAGGALVLLPIKANAYGHGAVAVARALQHHTGIWGYAVASPDEAWEYLEAQVAKPLVLFTPAETSQAQALAARGVQLAVSSVAELQALPAGSAVHIKLNTGMNRLGARVTALPELYALAQQRGIQVVGVFSHLASADSPDLSDARAQIALFQQAVAPLPATVLRHLANSAGIMAFGGQLGTAAGYSLIRPGIAAYGYPSDASLQGQLALRPALTWQARIGYILQVYAGERVSYGGTWQAERDTLVAVVQIGYGDGYPRGASGQALVKVAGEWRPVLGRICMDQCMVDVSGLEHQIAIDDQVELLGAGLIDAADVAAWVGTIPYEILTNLSRRVQRVWRE